MKNRPCSTDPSRNRRSFLKTSALGAGAAVALAGCASREQPFIPLLVPEDKILPGVEKWVPTTCLFCPAGCGILVRLMQGEIHVSFEGKKWRQQALQLKKIEGNPAHPVNLGRTCALGQSVPQVIYNPDRLRTPVKRVGARGQGKFEPVSWAEAEKMLDASLELGGQAPGFAVMTGTRSPARLALLTRLLSVLGSSRLYVGWPPGFKTLRAANQMIFGLPQLERHDLENAAFFFTIGADLLGSHYSPVLYSRALASFRCGRPGKRGRHIHAESRFSLTAANADIWLPVRPGAEGVLVLAIAHVLLKEGLHEIPNNSSAVSGFDEFRDWVLQRFSPAQRASEIDLPVERIVSAALEFGRTRPAIAMAGGSALAHPHGLFTAAAVQTLNAIAGTTAVLGGAGMGVHGAFDQNPAVSTIANSMDSFIAEMPSIKTLLLWETNPVYFSPAGSGMRGALEGIPRIVAFADSLNDSSLYADLVLPDLTFLERWDWAEPAMTPHGRVVSIVQPVIRPMYEGRDCASVLLQAAARAGGRAAEALPDPDFKAFLIRWLAAEDVLKRGSFVQDDADSFLSNLAETGVWSVDASEKKAVSIDLGHIAALEPQAFPALGEGELYLQPFFTTGFREGDSASLSWMQELPDPMSSVVWGSWMEIHPATARRLGIRDGEWALVESAYGRAKVAALVTPAARPDTVSIPFGQGHRSFGRYASDRGVNVWEILQPLPVRGTGDVAWAATRVRVRRTGEMSGMIRMGTDH